MKAYFLISALALLSTYGCTTSDDGAEKTLRDFYVLYIKQQASSEISLSKEAALKNKYCTKEFLQRIRKAELEADPFLNVQDFDEEWIKSLTVTKEDSCYQVCIHLNYENKENCVKVYVVKQGDRWLINDVK